MIAFLLLELALAVPHPARVIEPGCITMNTKDLPLASRQSPLDSLSFTVGKTAVKVCYGRPSARGRTMLGGEAVPYGRLWRTGANEPTMMHVDGPLTIAGVSVPAGTYSLYTIPGAAEWRVIVNRSITQWGEEHEYTAAVKAREAGTGRVTAESVTTPVDTLTFQADSASGGAAALVLTWEKTRVRIPLAAR